MTHPKIQHSSIVAARTYYSLRRAGFPSAMAHDLAERSADCPPGVVVACVSGALHHAGASARYALRGAA